MDIGCFSSDSYYDYSLLFDNKNFLSYVKKVLLFIVTQFDTLELTESLININKLYILIQNKFV